MYRVNIETTSPIWKPSLFERNFCWYGLHFLKSQNVSIARRSSKYYFECEKKNTSKMRFFLIFLGRKSILEILFPFNGGQSTRCRQEKYKRSIAWIKRRFSLIGALWALTDRVISVFLECCTMCDRSRAVGLRRGHFLARVLTMLYLCQPNSLGRTCRGNRRKTTRPDIYSNSDVFSTINKTFNKHTPRRSAAPNWPRKPWHLR